MSNPFCPRCGSEIKNGGDGTLCDACYVEEVDVVDRPENPVLRVCSACGSYVKEGNWTSEEDAKPESELAVELVQASLRAHVEAEDIRVGIAPERKDRNTFDVHISFDATVRGYPVHEEFTIPVNVSRETCSTCSRIAGGYYESIVQVRGENRPLRTEEKDRAKEIAYGIAGNDYEDRDTFVSKVEEVPEGLDIYMSTNKSGLQVSKRVVNEFGGTYSDSATLVGEREGDEVYRVTFSVRLPEFTEGDILLVGDRPVLVKRNHGKLKGIDLSTGREYEASNVEAEKIGEESEAKPTALVSEREDEIQVLNPETYETVTLSKPEFVTQEEGEDVKAVDTKKGLFLVPDDVEKEESNG
ncbi:MAG: NMD3-related protein [Halobacteria archaeon]|nr:NMD3-related protein [Halobacteria archaeon]